MKIEDITGSLGFVAEVGKNIAINQATKMASKALEGGINKIMVKHDSKIRKVLGHLGLDKGGDANIYDKIAGMPDPLFDWEFEVIMPSVSSSWAYAPPLPSHFVEDIDIPFENFSIEDMRVNSQSVKTIGFADTGDCTVSIYGDHENIAQKYVNAWYASMRSPEGIYALPYAPNNEGYKKLIQVIVYKGAVPVLALTMAGCMPSSRDTFPLKSTGDGRRVVGQTFAVDRVYITSLVGSEPTQTPMGSVTSTVGSRIGKSIVGAVTGGLNTKIRGFK